MSKSKQKESRDKQERMELASDVSNVALCAEKITGVRGSSAQADVPTITVSCTDADGTSKRFSTGSDYMDWNQRRSPQHGGRGGGSVQKFFDGMGVDRSVMEPMLSIQYANVNAQSSSSINLLESASTAGCMLDTDQDNCDRRSDLALPGMCSDYGGSQDGAASDAGARKARDYVTAEDMTQERVIEWLSTVSPSLAASTEDLATPTS